MIKLFPHVSETDAMIRRSRISRSFTEKHQKHGGNYRDHTLTAASIRKKRANQFVALPAQSVASLEKEFDDEMLKIEVIANEIRNTKGIISAILLRSYSAFVIQRNMRRFRARSVLKKAIASKTLTRFMKEKTSMKRYNRSAELIKTFLKSTFKWKAFFANVRIHRSAEKIQRQYRLYRRRKYIIFRVLIVWNTHKHTNNIITIATRKAYRLLRQLAEDKVSFHTKVLQRFVHRTLLRRRRKLLQGPLGKLAIFILATHFREYLPPEPGADATNHITDFIRHKVEAKILKSKTPMSKSSSPRIAAGGQSSGKYSTPRSKSDTYNFSAKDLPKLLFGVCAPRTVYETYQLIKDLLFAAKKNPTFVDYSIVPLAPVKIAALLKEERKKAAQLASDTEIENNKLQIKAIPTKASQGKSPLALRLASNSVKVQQKSAGFLPVIPSASTATSSSNSNNKNNNSSINESLSVTNTAIVAPLIAQQPLQPQQPDELEVSEGNVRTNSRGSIGSRGKSPRTTRIVAKLNQQLQDQHQPPGSTTQITTGVSSIDVVPETTERYQPPPFQLLSSTLIPSPNGIETIKEEVQHSRVNSSSSSKAGSASDDDGDKIKQVVQTANIYLAPISPLVASSINGTNDKQITLESLLSAAAAAAIGAATDVLDMTVSDIDSPFATMQSTLNTLPHLQEETSLDWDISNNTSMIMTIEIPERELTDMITEEVMEREDNLEDSLVTMNTSFAVSTITSIDIEALSISSSNVKQEMFHFVV